ncbi:acyl-CoA dehydrogenase family protein [Streptomyces krungchingensis]|uniref:acyl-CoA dehydrogenase family protein n=1 Tax=Streptomyces krungchingensis TaxID=1565034 RepID=UPI003CEAFB89
MHFLLDTEQRAFAASLDAMLSSADTPAVVRAWASGDHGPGRAVWSRLADAGVFALAAPEAYEGVGPLPVGIAVAFVELGRHAVPGPLAETVAGAALLAALGAEGPAERLLPAIVSGKSMTTLVLPGGGPFALDGDAADLQLTVRGTGAAAELRASPRAAAGPVGLPRTSLDPARRLALPRSGGERLAGGPRVADAAARALDWARLATAAQALGVGQALLDRTVGHVRRRTQFGVPIGSFQAVKHRLADARIALEFARPLLFGAALSMTPADVAAAKVTACEAAWTTARSALQLHGAIGYTAEYDLSLWLTKARALRTAWGTPAECRAEVLRGLSGAGPRS